MGDRDYRDGSIAMVPAGIAPTCYDERSMEESTAPRDDVSFGNIYMSEYPDEENWEMKARETVVEIKAPDNTTVKAYLSPLVKYEQTMEDFHSKIVDDNGKFNLVINALKGDILPDPLNNALNKVTGRQGESDFQIISLVRLLFLGNNEILEVVSTKQQIESALNSFPFWPTGVAGQPSMDKIIFWSENHLIMTLSSCYLFRQYKLNPEAADADEATKSIILGELGQHLETKLLKIYLRAHCLDVFNGVYEVNSSVYLPYTVSGLLNLYDFAIDEEVKRLAKQILDRIVYHVLLCTTSNGTSNLCAGGRTFARTRLRTHGHNINQFVNVLIGKSPDAMCPSAITDFILTTSWRPNFEEMHKALDFCGTHPPLHLSHPTSITRDLYERLAQEEDVRVDPQELVPLYWSAGLITNPEFVTDTRHYLEAKHMLKNENLSALSNFSAPYLKGKMSHYHTLSLGQSYTGITLNVYKEPMRQLCLSSFEDFNPHAASFQQLPWIANVSGMGVWTQAGSGSEGFLNFGMTNTHNPLITQKGSVLIASHVAPASLTGWFIMGSMFSSAVRLYWPLLMMDEWAAFNAKSPVLFSSGTHPAAHSPMVMHSTVSTLNAAVQRPLVWVAGRRRDAYVAVCCTQKTHMDHRATKDAEMKETSSSNAVNAPRRICREYRHSWVVIVGSRRDYPALKDFVEKRCLAMTIDETNGGSSWLSANSSYEIQVTDAVEGSLSTRIALPPAARI